MARLWNYKFRQLKWDAMCSNWDIFKSPDLLEQKFIFSIENKLLSKIENLTTSYSIFHNFRSWASFFPHFWIIQWMLQPLTTNNVNTTLEKKNSLCTFKRFRKKGGAGARAPTPPLFRHPLQVQSEFFISSVVFISLVVRGCNIHCIIQKRWENDAQLLKLWKIQ